MNRIQEYLHKSKIQRQIMSNKSKLFGRLSVAQNATLVAVSGFITFIGFSGMAAVATYLQVIWPAATENGAQLLFNIIAFVLFIVGILHLVFNFGGKHTEASRAVARLAAFANEVEDRLSMAESSKIEAWELDSYRAKYTSIMESIPENSDKEYLKAQSDYYAKLTERKKVIKDLSFAFIPEEQQRIVRNAIESSDSVMTILKVIREVGPQFYAGGGLIRNLIWDRLHDYRVETPYDDVDVIYFDGQNAAKEHDQALESRLRSVSPNAVWSVKNQARMHSHNGEEPYASLEDAVSRWPETCTAILCRLDAAEQLQFVAPFGFDDLVRLLVVPTPHFHDRQQTIVKRIREKGWVERWPRLRLALSKESVESLSAHAGV